MRNIFCELIQSGFSFSDGDLELLLFIFKARQIIFIYNVIIALAHALKSLQTGI